MTTTEMAEVAEATAIAEATEMADASGTADAGVGDRDGMGAVLGAPTGDELRAMRQAVRMTQSELARRAGFSRGLVAEVERGRRLSVRTRRRLAEALQTRDRAA